MLAQPAHAQHTVIEEEPNDTPQTAIEVSGAAILAGTMDGADQDGYRWRVTDEDAGKRWTLQLDGIPGRLTVVDVVRLAYDDAGEVTLADTLFKMGTRDGTLPAIAPDLVFEPGEYLLGVAQAGGASYRPPMDAATFSAQSAVAASPSATGAYRLRLIEGAPFYTSAESPHADRESARLVRPRVPTGTFLDSASSVWYRFELSEADGNLRWNVAIQAPVGRNVHAGLTQADGETLSRGASDQRGKLVFPELALSPGEYFLEVMPSLREGESPGFVETLVVEEDGQRIDGDEAEPNGYWQHANRIDWDNCCTGRIEESGDQDHFSFDIDAERADTLQAITLESASETAIRLCLLDRNGGEIQCREGTGKIILGNLLLPAGSYGMSVARGNVGDEYRLAFESAGTPVAGQETEPNDILAFATGTPPSNRIRGSFDRNGDVDFYRLVIADEAQLWRIQAIGDSLSRVAYHDAYGTPKQRIDADPGQKRVRLENLFLLPGVHYISLTGRDAGDYTLLARKLGPPDPNGEFEPNDDTSRMQLLRIAQTRTGLLADPGDADMYRFYLADFDHIRLTATPPADGLLQARLSYNGNIVNRALRTDGPLVLQGVFPPGDYYLQLEPRQISDAEYTLSLERLDRFACADDCEPNDALTSATPLPPHRSVRGRAGDWDDVDWFALPVYANDQAVRITIETDGYRNVDVFGEHRKELDFGFDPVSNTYSGTLPADTKTFFTVGLYNQAADYVVTLLLDEEAGPPSPPPALPVELALEFEVQAIAAYERVGQQVAGRLTVRNEGADALALTLDSATSDARWRLEFEHDTLRLEPGAELIVPAIVHIARDAWADIPVRVGARASAGEGRFVSAYADVDVSRDALPSSPVHAWEIPEKLRGGLDVARIQFGAVPSSEPAALYPAENLLQAFDGTVAAGTGPVFSRQGESPVTLTVDLAGDDLLPVAGFAVNPMSASENRAPKDLVFQLSENGSDFRTVASGRATTAGVDQFFTLDDPIPARFARLVLLNNWDRNVGSGYNIGAFKVIAEPGFDPFSGQGSNIADIGLGGHIVWANPWISPGWDDALLTPAETSPFVRVPPNKPLEWVVGFNDNRAAQIIAIDWSEAANNEPIDELTVSVSLDSPVGPWRKIADWSRARHGTVIELEQPEWARFVRFFVAPAENDRTLRVPDRLQIRERLTGSDYRSVLGEWGYRSDSAFYESQQPVMPRPRLEQRGNESRATAAILSPQVTETGLVRLGEQSHWYVPAIPAGHNTLRFTLSGDPTVRTELFLTDADGETVALRKIESESSSWQHRYEATAEIDNRFYIEVREPPRNVMFLWDTSPSVNPYLPMIYNSLIAYAEDLEPGRDAANLLPFGGSTPLLRDWHGEPYLMQMILNDYPRRDSSSSAESTQYAAANQLASRPGTKAIVMITDASTPRYAPMWDAYREVQPRVFVMKVASGEIDPLGTEREQDLSQDWARVNGGHYSYLSNEGEMEVAFDRAATLMRRPANYALSLESEYREATGPGSLRVSRGENPDAAGGAVELILDASGSMWQKLDGRFRIDIAREVLTRALQEHIPAGTPTALRVFGHRKPNACDTNLEIPLRPLDVDATIAALNSVSPQSLARTPIGAALAAVSGDLNANDGAAIVVLVTDGEETCDGNPLAEIERLKASGIGISLNIVGFAIEDNELATQFTEWAQAGGGRYFKADNAEGLNDAVAQALATPFTVYDASGAAVAQGIVDGEAIELEEGNYKVVVESGRQRVFENVAITGAGNTALDL
jgi:hypothetical protein